MTDSTYPKKNVGSPRLDMCIHGCVPHIACGPIYILGFSIGFEDSKS